MNQGSHSFTCIFGVDIPYFGGYGWPCNFEIAGTFLEKCQTIVTFYDIVRLLVDLYLKLKGVLLIKWKDRS